MRAAGVGCGGASSFPGATVPLRLVANQQTFPRSALGKRGQCLHPLLAGPTFTPG